MTLMYVVRKRRQLTDKSGRVIGIPGDMFPGDDENCKAQPSAVRRVNVEDEPPGLYDAKRTPSVFDDTATHKSEE